MPRGDISLRPTDRDRRRIQWLTRRWDTSVTDAIRRAVVHAVASEERGEPIHTFVPSERATDEEDEG